MYSVASSLGKQTSLTEQTCNKAHLHKGNIFLLQFYSYFYYISIEMQKEIFFSLHSNLMTLSNTAAQYPSVRLYCHTYICDFYTAVILHFCLFISQGVRVLLSDQPLLPSVQLCTETAVLLRNSQHIFKLIYDRKYC